MELVSVGQSGPVRAPCRVGHGGSAPAGNTGLVAAVDGTVLTWSEDGRTKIETKHVTHQKQIN